MTRVLPAEDIARRVNEIVPGAAFEHNETDVWIEPESILDVARFLNGTSGLEFNFLTAISAVDYIEYFELVYHLLSMTRNQSIILKTRVYGREEPAIPSVTEIWKGAELQEREIWDLMGIHFEGHPNKVGHFYGRMCHKRRPLLRFI